ncbi:HD domain-containing protein [Mobilitalea sibirica]|uniref:HD domain-containing protein n=1 Tax=Mobilitalea sibirica TaxID=1462919 RepID=A0A8J7KZD1_9FIRM|nr:HD domain-containing protein [Mobilitalea sibirica]MBH1939963.1 HD domain-containing protein [Mobilitalea sibirica]
MVEVGQVMNAMIDYYRGDIKRINHFLKVYGFAKAIGEAEDLDQETQTILEVAALTHDIGIKNSELKYNSSAGKYQELEGPLEAELLLNNLSIQQNIIDRVCWLIAHHHTYNNINGIDHQILIEADFLVNAYEDNLSRDAIYRIYSKIFTTNRGKAFINLMYDE